MEIQWSLLLFTAITGAAGWAYAALALGEVRGKVGSGGFTVALILLAVLAVGGLASVTHLSHPENMMAALTHPTSGIFIEAMLMGLTGASALVYLVIKKREGNAVALKVFALLAGVFGVVLSFMAGDSYVVSSQPAWNTPLMPLGYCLTAAPCGVALYLVLARPCKVADDSAVLGTALSITGVLGAVSALAWGAASTFRPIIGLRIGLAVGGGLVAAVLGWLIRSGKQVVVIAVVALICAFIGAIAYRYGMWEVGYGINNFFGAI